MKTIQFTGTEHKVDNLHLALGISAQQSETRVYVLDTADFGDQTKHYSELTDDEFQTLAEKQGRVYTLEGFQEAFNFEEINSAIDVIRFINVIKFS